MPDNVPENKEGESWLSRNIVKITTIVVALTGLVTALIHFRDSIPWLTPVNAVELAPNPVNLDIGDKFQVIATVLDANKNPLAKKVSWSIANPALVQVDGDGIVTGNAPGETTITASIGFVKALAPVHVRRVTVATVDVFPPATTLLVDDHLKFDATPYDSEGNSLLGRPVRWSSDNNLVAAVDQSSGDATGKSAGTVKVTAESEGKANTAQVIVSPRPAQPTRGQPPAAPAPAAALPPTASNRAAERVRVGELGRVATARPPLAGVARLPPAGAPVSTLMKVAFAEKIAFANALKFGACPANIRILIGDSLIDLKSDPQEAVRIPLGDVTYNLHGTVSCPRQTVAVVNGRGTISIVNGKTYRCAWRQKSPKDFEIVLQPQ